VEEILSANPGVSDDATTLPPGFPLNVPAYYVPLTGSPFHILPDSEFVNGPSAVGFDIRQAILSHPGFLAELSAYAYEIQRPAWGVVEIVAKNYSINPRLLLALLEFRTQALSNPFPEAGVSTYPMNIRQRKYSGLFWQLVWVAELLNDGYYGWRTGKLQQFELLDGYLVRPDPWLNAATVGLQFLFANLYGLEDFNHAVGPEGFYRNFETLWGEPFALEETFIPGNLQQPELPLPFEEGRVWHYSGGPHSCWGNAQPFGALDFAPPAEREGCIPSSEWVVAPASGTIARSGEATVVLDLDGDGDERTGWTLFFFHMVPSGTNYAGLDVEAGYQLGHPSCEGGRATGTHVHIARKYNGEWIPATGPMPFVFDGWLPGGGDEAYEGTLMKGSKVIEACPCSVEENMILYSFP
jgi:hypothetical protein